MSDRVGLAALGRDWSKLADADPLWAICVDPAKRGGRWDLGEFLASGEEEVAQIMAELSRLGLAIKRRDALDFGCGVGRVTAALTKYFGAVSGVDIAPPMLARARDIHAGNDRCRFLHNDDPDLTVFGDCSFDLVYSSLVLQHLPPALAESYLAEFIRVMRPGGAVVIVVPEVHHRTLRGLVYAYAPQVLIRLLQRRVFGFPAPMRMHALPGWRVRELVTMAGADVVASVDRPLPGHWKMSAHFIAKSPVGGRDGRGGRVPAS